MRTEFVSCETKGFYSFQRNLRSPVPSIDLIAGGAFARGLEVTRKLFYGSAQWPLEKAIEEGMKEALVHYGDVVVPEAKEQKGPDRVLTALKEYFLKYPPGADYVQPYMVDGEPSVEFTFTIPLPINHPDSGEPILYAGRFDLLGLFNGQLICVDEKTTSQLGASWAKQWNLRSQFTGYCWAAQQYGLPVVGALVRGVSFLKFTKANPGGHGFEESIQMRPDWMIEAWYNQLLRDVNKMVAAYKEGFYDQNLHEACGSYSGCPFQRLCTVQDPDNWIEGYYLPREWHPTAKVPYDQPQGQAIELINDPDLLELFKNS
jgi:hypothetical protein